MKILESRTFQTATVMFLLGGVQAIESVLPSALFVLIQAVLLALVGYFRQNPQVQF